MNEQVNNKLSKIIFEAINSEIWLNNLSLDNACELIALKNIFPDFSANELKILYLQTLESQKKSINLIDENSLQNTTQHYLKEGIPLYEAIAIWMHSNEPCPEWLKSEYQRAIMVHETGGDFMLMMGFDLAKGINTPTKRAQHDRDLQIAASLKYILEDLVKLGLRKVTPLTNKAENKMSKEVLEKVTDYLYTHCRKMLKPHIAKVNKITVTDHVDEDTISIVKEKIVLTDNFKHELEYKTAYQVAGLIFDIGESKVRKLEMLNY